MHSPLLVFFFSFFLFFFTDRKCVGGNVKWRKKTFDKGTELKFKGKETWKKVIRVMISFRLILGVERGCWTVKIGSMYAKYYVICAFNVNDTRRLMHVARFNAKYVVPSMLYVQIFRSKLHWLRLKRNCRKLMFLCWKSIGCAWGYTTFDTVLGYKWGYYR